METMTALDAAARHPNRPPPAPRRLHATTIVTALYVALVLGAPAIVRFAPDAGAPWVTAGTAQPIYVQCASVPARPTGCVSFPVAEAGVPARIH